MGEVDSENSIRWLIVQVISIPKITVTGHPLLKLQLQSHVFETVQNATGIQPAVLSISWQLRCTSVRYVDQKYDKHVRTWPQQAFHSKPEYVSALNLHLPLSTPLMLTPVSAQSAPVSSHMHAIQKCIHIWCSKLSFTVLQSHRLYWHTPEKFCKNKISRILYLCLP